MSNASQDSGHDDALASGSIARAFAGTQATILVVEDDHDARVTLRGTLEDAGYTVLSVTEGRSALAVLRLTIPQPALILLDLRLPLMDGWQLAAEVRRTPELADIPIVAMSGQHDRTPPAGVSAFLKKPVNAETLLRAVAEHCRAVDDSLGEPWRFASPREGEDARWETGNGRWIAICVGSGDDLGTMLVSDSTGRLAVVESYEGALDLARSWRRDD